MLWVLSLLVGGVAGLGAVAFRALIGIFHNLFFLGKFSLAYDANMHHLEKHVAGLHLIVLRFPYPARTFHEKTTKMGTLRRSLTKSLGDSVPGRA
jgi:hypothetical protein